MDAIIFARSSPLFGFNKSTAQYSLQCCCNWCISSGFGETELTDVVSFNENVLLYCMIIWIYESVLLGHILVIYFRQLFMKK